MTSCDRLIKSLKSLEVPGIESWSGTDLDWMFEDERSADLIHWIAECLAGGDRDIFLSESELEEWNKLRNQDPKSILEGELLDQALGDLKWSEENKESNLDEEELRSRINDLTEELDLQTATLDSMSWVVQGLSAKMSSQATAMALTDPLEASTRHGQESLVNANEKYNSALTKLSTRIEEFIHSCQNFGNLKEDFRLLSEACLDEIEQEEEIFHGNLKDFCHKSFEGLRSECVHILREMTEKEEYLSKLDLSRLKYSNQVSEINKTVCLSKLTGLLNTDEFVNSYIKNFSVQQVNEAFDVNSLLASQSEMEGKINSLQRDVYAWGRNEKLKNVARRKANVGCENIYSFALQNKVYFQSDTLQRLENFQTFALDQRARQSVLSSLCSREHDNLRISFVQQIQAFGEKHYEKARSFSEKESICVSNLKKFEADKKRGVMHESDLALKSVLCMVTNENVDCQKIVTNLEGLTILETFRERFSSMKEEHLSKQSELKEFGRNMEQLGRKIKFKLNLDCGKHLTLCSPLIYNKVNQIQSELRTFEISVKEAKNKWTEESKILSDPHLSTQRRLWIDFVLKPKVLKANVEVIRKKSVS